jgi:hypothetical protein
MPFGNWKPSANSSRASAPEADHFVAAHVGGEEGSVVEQGEVVEHGRRDVELVRELSVAEVVRGEHRLIDARDVAAHLFRSGACGL